MEGGEGTDAKGDGSMKRTMRRGLEFHSASASSAWSSGTATSSACAAILLAPPPPVLPLSPPPQLNGASPWRAPLQHVPCPLSFLLPRLPLPPTATPPAALTWNPRPRRGHDKAAAARGSSVTGTLADARATTPGRDGVRRGKDDDGGDVVVVDWQWPSWAGEKEKNRKEKIREEVVEKKRDESRNESSSQPALRLRGGIEPDPTAAVAPRCGGRGACVRAYRSKSSGSRYSQTHGVDGDKGITVRHGRCFSLPANPAVPFGLWDVCASPILPRPSPLASAEPANLALGAAGRHEDG
ncbi:hypothetical protein PR202_ga26271 [Eleusine coracana subsp. coracana]|uniref:Uncharacterized protein n=1 Tax=Eleusine coracana subsp. coracana TaxID=191504 RepID=A0AAV5DD68_ELECO|nr:hypothetical protein PR202_ga26271 [Eleusine coracana subsp. coracana]